MAEQGTGPLLLLCHGFPELWYSWRKQILVLAEASYHVVALDMRGYGQTDQPTEQEAYTLLHLVADLVGVLEALGESQAALIGHDWGSNVCWQAALMRPDLFPVLVTPPWLTESDLAYYVQEFSRTGFTGGLNWYRNSDRNWELLAAYINAPIAQPTLFLCGRQDPLFELVDPDAWIEQMRRWVPAIQTKVLPGCGHWIQQERAEEVNATLLAFLREQTRDRG